MTIQTLDEARRAGPGRRCVGRRGDCRSARKHAFARSGFCRAGRRAVEPAKPQVGSGSRPFSVGGIVGSLSFYDPTTGTFLTRDPITPITRSVYGYVYGNPLNASDPSGLMCWNPTDKDCWSEWGDNVNPDDNRTDGAVISLCGGAAAYIVFGAKADLCWNFEGADFTHGSVTLSPGGGMGTPSGGLGGSVGWHPDAESVHDLEGFGVYGGAGAWFCGLSGDTGFAFNDDGSAETTSGGSFSIGKNWALVSLSWVGDWLI